MSFKLPVMYILLFSCDLDKGDISISTLLRHSKYHGEELHNQ